MAREEFAARQCLKHGRYQVLLEQPHHLHPQQSYAGKGATLAGSDSQELECTAAVQHRGAAQKGNVLAPAAARGHSKQSGEKISSGVEASVPDQQFTGNTPLPPLHEAYTKSPKSSSGAQTDFEQQYNKKSPQLFTEPT